MKRTIFLLFISILSLATRAQVTVSDKNAELRKVGDFKGVKVSSGIELLLQQSDQNAVAVSATKSEYTSRIKTEVHDGILKISIENSGLSSGWRKNVTFKAYVSIRTLELLDASSGSRVTTGSAITVNDLKLEASSGAIINAEFKANSIKSENSSGAITELKGSTGAVNVEASSGAMFKGFNLTSTTGTADASSGGLIDLNITKELNAEASSGGLINYKGGGVIRTVKTSSGGSVQSKS
jgi:putative autotransporter adhesin-like protein